MNIIRCVTFCHGRIKMMVAAFEQLFCYYFGNVGRTCWVWWWACAGMSGANLTKTEGCDGCCVLVLSEVRRQTWVGKLRPWKWEDVMVEFFFVMKQSGFLLKVHVWWGFWCLIGIFEITIEMDHGGPNYDLHLWFRSDGSITKLGVGQWERGDEASGSLAAMGTVWASKVRVN